MLHGLQMLLTIEDDLQGPANVISEENLQDSVKWSEIVDTTLLLWEECASLDDEKLWNKTYVVPFSSESGETRPAV